MNRREFLLVLSGVMTAVWGLRAEQKPMPVIGYLSGVSPGDSAPALAAFRQGWAKRVMPRAKRRNRIPLGGVSI